MVQLDTAADSKAAFGVTRESISVSFFLPPPMHIQPVTCTRAGEGAHTYTDTPDNFLVSSLARMMLALLEVVT